MGTVKINITMFFLAAVFSHTASIDAQASQNRSGDVARVEKNSAVQADSIPPDHTGMRYLSSIELAKEMVPGWNVGNSLEAIGGETAWGNPQISQRLIDSVKTAGFNAIRIPVAWSNSMDMRQPNSRPEKFSLMQNYPNPYNSSTTLSFFLPSRAYVSLQIFDLMGKEVATIESVELPAGTFKRTWDASSISSGVYFCRLQAGPQTESRKLILLR